MKIAMVPTDPRAGVTVCTWAAAMGLAYKQGRTVRVCYTGDNPALKRYIGRDSIEQDKTRSISQVSKLLQAHAIAPDELGNYCLKVGPNLELLDSYSEALTPDEVQEIITFVFDRSDSDYTLCDVCDGIGDPLTDSIIGVADVVCLVADTSWSALTRARMLVEANQKLLGDKEIMIIVNRYDPAIMTRKKAAQIAKSSPRHTAKLHWNPYITKGCNIQDLQSVFISCYESDPRVIELKQDIREITQLMLSYNSEKIRWED